MHGTWQRIPDSALWRLTDSASLGLVWRSLFLSLLFFVFSSSPIPFSSPSLRASFFFEKREKVNLKKKKRRKNERTHSFFFQLSSFTLLLNRWWFKLLNVEIKLLVEYRSTFFVLVFLLLARKTVYATNEICLDVGFEL